MYSVVEYILNVTLSTLAIGNTMYFLCMFIVLLVTNLNPM